MFDNAIQHYRKLVVVFTILFHGYVWRMNFAEGGKMFIKKEKL